MTDLEPEAMQDKATELVRYFVNALRTCGSPGLQAPSLCHIERHQRHATKWGYPLPTVSTALGTRCWQLVLNNAQEPGGWKSTYWNELIVTTAGQWVVLGSGFGQFDVAGAMRDIGVPIVVESTATTGATERMLKAIFVALRKFLEKHSIDSVPGLEAISDN